MTQFLSIKDKFAAAIKANQRVWSHDRRKTLGASETFTCLRRAYYMRNDAEATEMSMGAAERGNIMEKHFIVPKLQYIYGEDNVKYASDDQESFILGLNSVTPDALIVNQPKDALIGDGLVDIESDCFATEIKSFDPRKSVHEASFEHVGQSQIQLHAFRTLTPYKPTYSIVLYVNASFYDDVRPFIVKYDPHVFKVAQDRAKEVYAARDPLDLMPEGAFTGACDYCPYAAICKDAEVRSVPGAKNTLDTTSTEALGLLLQEAVDVKQAITPLNKRKKEIDFEVKTFLRAHKTSHAITEFANVAFTAHDGKTKLDDDKLDAFLTSHGKTRAEFEDAGNDYTKLTITPKKRKKS
jgi:CRISPR/Cas system-associated exonuclease Cas4 (RecB family)